MSERRKLERLSPLVIRAQFPGEAELRQGYLTNLSEAGAFLATEELLPIGGPILLHFSLPWGLGEHSAVASVVWRTRDAESQIGDVPSGAGLVFTSLEPAAREAIRRYMQRFYEAVAKIKDKSLNEVLSDLGSGSTS